MAKELTVWLHNVAVGTLFLQAGRLAFQYSADALAQADIPALSCSLPKRAEPYDDHQCRPFFGGLLPEGRLRNLLARQAQLSSQNEFGLLAAVGGECAGAVTLTAPLASPAPPPRQTDVRWLDDDELARVLEVLPRRPMLIGMEGLRLSLAGAQDKLPVVVQGNRIGLPVNGGLSTHIMKPAIAEVEDSVTNEAFCLALTRAAGIPTAKAHIHETASTRVLLVERYDRAHAADGTISRIHQEDFCQALGVVSENKYQAEGGPSFDQCFDLLRRSTRPSAPHVARLLDHALLNALIGNHDAHGKNFSLLYAGRHPVLAPAYDVLSTSIYPALTPKMAMKIGGKYKFSEIREEHWERFSESCGLGPAMAKKRLRELANTLPAIAKKVAAQDPAFSGNPVVGRILDVIEHRTALTLRNIQSARQVLLDGIQQMDDAAARSHSRPKGKPGLR